MLLFGAVTVRAQETLCVGSVKQFAVDLTENNGNGTTGSTYTWQVMTGGFAGNITPITTSGNHVEIDWGATPLGSYTLRVTEFNGCENFREMKILLTGQLELDILEDMLICPDGGSTTFDAGPGYDTYEWYDANGNLLSDTPQLTVYAPGTFTLTVTQNGCTATETVNANPLSFPVFVVNTDNFNMIKVEHIGGNVDNLEYQLEDLSGNIIKPWQTQNIFNNIKEGVYIVRIRTWDPTCSTYVTVSTVSIPNAITPNGDGYNDVWDLSRLQRIDPDAHVEVYDRSGKLIKKITSEDNFKWDGKYLGNPLPSTSYVYIMYIGGEKITGYLLIKNY